MTKSSLVKNAIEFIMEKLNGKPNSAIETLLDEAGMRFNLSPKEAQELRIVLKRIQKS